MKFPAWVPQELLNLHERLLPQAKEERLKALEQKAKGLDREYNVHTQLQAGQLHVGDFYLSYQAQMDVLEPLMTRPKMEAVFKSLKRRADVYKPGPAFPYGGASQATNLFGACMECELHWLNLPKRTKAESKRLFKDIADSADRLINLLLEERQNADLLDTRSYITRERMDEFIAGLEKDDYELWNGVDGYISALLAGLLDTIPEYLLQLKGRALEHGENPITVPQPNSPSAKVNFYIEHLSHYFRKSYAQPFHAHVATIVSVVFGTDVDEDRVRALLRSRTTAPKPRKKVAAKKNSSSG